MQQQLAKRNRYEAGVTLVELIVSIAVISIGLAGILLVMNRNTSASADPMVQHQAVAVAEAYMEEILAKDFCDPDSAPGTCTGGLPGSATCNVCPVAEASRSLYDNVCDYRGLPDNVVRDPTTGLPVNALSAYSVQVAIMDNGAVLNGLTGANCQVLRVDVTVTGPGGTTYTLNGYRTNY